jgi:uncharacterized repeat protein (TIGR01451 family)
MPKSRPHAHAPRRRYWHFTRQRAAALIPVVAATAILGTSAASAKAASADLATTVSPNGWRMMMGPVTFTATVTNDGPDYADNVVISDNWSGGMSTFQSVSATAPSGASCTAPRVGTRGTVTCTTSSLAPDHSMTVRVTVRDMLIVARAPLEDTATTTSTTFDPNTANNTATATDLIIS